ncbi:tRNA wybutosine-synthesizing protein [Lasiodiplodia theobromae]|uniref:tRNA(Phe) 7-[(3-amino-3-carboxypropyl)-4-demethylwyosine(37)-N(4)]-methyltransferase n=1 Tax=Lasiodiplodia theobromae TaxID=45133 RepID=A0A5N5CYY2_9PEZI|nr:tRNA wybutosine-synthesizing protein [Lasiodiplodia theobromae]KAB2570526.1 tRNA wybutosine-synthesizing protein 3 [Lasiodiplodia theobromae]KAF4537510.1 tRNA wybutosine-synthesizing protein [Lasiodiplodia theobromae]KAF9639522.1 tRNA wybutosine-synthesizing protein [Lasiodiplodia theobromae]
MASAFAAKKHRILQQLAQPAAEYSDASPKGSIDEGIRTLIDEINAIEGLVTTSSCAGRISAFLEGRKRAAASEPREAPAETSIAGAGGKGGGQWLFVSHEPVPMPAADAARAGQHFTALFGLDAAGGLARAEHHAGQRHVHLKFEAMILHLLTASLADAQRVLSAALQAGFRESGAVGLHPNTDGSITPMVAVRSIGLTFDSVIACEGTDGRMVPVVDEQYLQSLVELANDRFSVNTERIERFRAHLLAQFRKPGELATLPKGKKGHPGWEDAAARRERKRAEGLENQRQKNSTQSDSTAPTHGDIALDSIFD